MTNEEYAFFLAYGVSNDTDLSTQEMLDSMSGLHYVSDDTASPLY